jgi:hypothetical protein
MTKKRSLFFEYRGVTAIAGMALGIIFESGYFLSLIDSAWRAEKIS